jgi:hypothetical protein
MDSVRYNAEDAGAYLPKIDYDKIFGLVNKMRDFNMNLHVVSSLSVSNVWCFEYWILVRRKLQYLMEE